MITPFQKYEFFYILLIDDEIESVLRNIDSIFSKDTKKIEYLRKSQIDFSLICDQSMLDYRGTGKFLLFEPTMNTNQTVFFVNQRDGWSSLLHIYANKYKKRVVKVGFTMNRSIDSAGYFFDYLYYNKEDQFQERCIYLIKDPKWKFYENSEKTVYLSFENPEYYKSKRKLERFNNDIIFEYLNKIGFDVNNSYFFETKKEVIYANYVDKN